MAVELAQVLQEIGPDLSAPCPLVVEQLPPDELGDSFTVNGIVGWVSSPKEFSDFLAYEMHVLESVQDLFLESFGPQGKVWPECPIHPTHPLFIQRLKDSLIWACDRSKSGLAALGELSLIERNS